LHRSAPPTRAGLDFTKARPLNRRTLKIDKLIFTIGSGG